MENLLHLYQNIDKSIWDYYNEINPDNKANNPFIDNPNSADDHQQFIRDYFRLSGKKEVLRQFGTNDTLSDERAYHTNSVFLLGLLIRENTILKTQLFNAKRSTLGYPIFPLLWFLSVLFHDFGMKIEKDLINHPELASLDGLLNHYNIQHSILDAMPRNINENLFAAIRPYYAYRSSEHKIDHGILAGIYLYDRLVTIRRHKWQIRDKELSWHHSLEKKYALAATAIACHNMWTKDPLVENVTVYENAGLNYLIRPAFQKISLSNFPLLFLFGIVDTIDPLKLYMKRENGEHQPEEILENLEISFGKRIIKFRNRIDSPLVFEHFINQVKGLTDWLTVDITDTGNNVTIKFYN